MFASKVDLYNTEKVLGGPEGSVDRYDTAAPALPAHRRAVGPAREAPRARRRRADRTATPPTAPASSPSRASVPAPRAAERGRSSTSSPRTTAREPKTATFPTWTKGTGACSRRVFGTDTARQAGADGSVKVTVPPLAVQRLEGEQADLDRRRGPDGRDRRWPTVAPTAAPRSGPTSRRAPSRRPRSCGARSATTTWQHLGTDDNAPFRVFHDVSGIPLATPLEYRAVVKDAAGRVGRRLLVVQVVSPPPQTVPELGDPAAEPAERRRDRRDAELARWGAPADWEPGCARGRSMTLDAERPDLEEGRSPCPPGRTPTRRPSTAPGPRTTAPAACATARTSTYETPTAR